MTSSKKKQNLIEFEQESQKMNFTIKLQAV